MLNRQSRIGDKRWLFSLGVGLRIRTSLHPDLVSSFTFDPALGKEVNCMGVELGILL
jgi:hypothetical protein